MADPKSPNVQGSTAKPDVTHPSSAHSVNPRHSAGSTRPKDDEEHKKAQEKFREETRQAALGGTPKPPDFKNISLSEGASRMDALNAPGAAPLGAYDHLIGDLWPGAFGWLPLDEFGEPSGPATIEAPPEGTPACKVFANAASSFAADLLVSASGAPLTPPLNPNSDVRVMGSNWVDPGDPGAPIDQSRTKANERAADSRTSTRVHAKEEAAKAEAAARA